MTLAELQTLLGERIKMAADTSLPTRARQQETEISKTISSLAKQMINLADVTLRAEKLISEGKLKDSTIEKMVKGDGEIHGGTE